MTGAVTEDVRKASLFSDVEEVSGKTQGRKRAARFPPTGRVHRGVKAQGSVCYALERVSQQVEDSAPLEKSVATK